MRISDWSSDVCSSDLRHFVVRADLQKVRLELVAGADIDRMHIVFESQLLQHDMDLMAVRRRPGIELDGHAVSPTQEEGCSLAGRHGSARTLMRCGRHWRIWVGRATCRERVCQYV